VALKIDERLLLSNPVSLVTRREVEKEGARERENKVSCVSEFTPSVSMDFT
jgi:hypothetical protein